MTQRRSTAAGLLAGLLILVAVSAYYPTSSDAARAVSGKATYYAYVEGQAAAGPALRRMLGAHWRGQYVTVKAGGVSVTVKLTDWCACGPRHGQPTVIDLDQRDFAEVAGVSLSGIDEIGVLDVVVRSSTGGSPRSTLPPTDTE